MTTVISALGRRQSQAATAGPFTALSVPPVMMSSMVPSFPSYTGLCSLACFRRSSAISSCCCCLFFWAWTCAQVRAGRVGGYLCSLLCCLARHKALFSCWVNTGWVPSHSTVTLGSCCLASSASCFSLIACSCFFLSSFSSTASCWQESSQQQVAQINQGWLLCLAKGSKARHRNTNSENVPAHRKCRALIL